MLLCVKSAMMLLAVYTAASSLGMSHADHIIHAFFQVHTEQLHIWCLGKCIFSTKNSRCHNSLAKMD